MPELIHRRLPGSLIEGTVQDQRVRVRGLKMRRVSFEVCGFWGSEVAWGTPGLDSGVQSSRHRVSATGSATMLQHPDFCNFNFTESALGPQLAAKLKVTPLPWNQKTLSLKFPKDPRQP